MIPPTEPPDFAIEVDFGRTNMVPDGARPKSLKGASMDFASNEAWDVIEVVVMMVLVVLVLLVTVVVVLVAEHPDLHQKAGLIPHHMPHICNLHT